MLSICGVIRVSMFNFLSDHQTLCFYIVVKRPKDVMRCLGQPQSLSFHLLYGVFVRGRLKSKMLLPGSDLGSHSSPQDSPTSEVVRLNITKSAAPNPKPVTPWIIMCVPLSYAISLSTIDLKITCLKKKSWCSWVCCDCNGWHQVISPNLLGI